MANINELHFHCYRVDTKTDDPDWNNVVRMTVDFGGGKIYRQHCKLDQMPTKDQLSCILTEIYNSCSAWIDDNIEPKKPTEPTTPT